MHKRTDGRMHTVLYCCAAQYWQVRTARVYFTRQGAPPTCEYVQRTPFAESLQALLLY